MNIIFVTSLYSNENFNKLLQSNTVKDGYQSQKFYHLLLEGLSQISDCNITVISEANKLDQRRIVRRFEEVDNNIKIIHPGMIKFPLLKHLSFYYNTKRVLKELLCEDTIILGGYTGGVMSFATLDIARKYNTKAVNLILDVIGHMSGAYNEAYDHGLKGKFIKYIDNKTIAYRSKYDGYILLAEAMNEIVNPLGKQHIVVEGFSDQKMINIHNDINNKNNPKVVMYAGSLHRQYGVMLLVEAFIKCNLCGWELHLYGRGNCEEELKQISQDNISIKYKGVLPNEEIVDAQTKATLLVNPRPTNEDFVKLSFPSKTIECMASGTPLLTTRIPSMPKDYYDYVYFIENETVEGISSKLNEITSLQPEELHKKGELAKSFIIETRSNIKMSERIYSFLAQL